MAICISAGSSFEGALAAVGTRMGRRDRRGLRPRGQGGILFQPLRGPAGTGGARAGELDHLLRGRRSWQAERAGSSLVDIIRMQAQSVRTERRLKVDDITNKLSTKMLFPMLLLMLPSIIMLMLAPMILQLGEFF